MSINRFKNAFGKAARALVQRGIISSEILGYRWLCSRSQEEYVSSWSGKIERYRDASTIDLPLPANVSSRDKLSRENGRYERSFFDVPEFSVEPSWIASVHDVKVLRHRNEWGDDTYCIVGADRSVIRYSGMSYVPAHRTLLKNSVVSRRIDEACWITSHSTRNHYMWLYNHLSRFFVAEEMGFRDRVIFPELGLLNPVKRESLSRLGLESVGSVKTTDEVISFEKLHLVEADGFDPVILRGMRSRLVGDVSSQRRDKIYISRQKAGFRKLSNAIDVEQLLDRHGFKTVFLEDLTLGRQIETLANAGVVVGAHGAGFANILFCPEGCSIIEIQDPEDANPHFYALAALLNLRYFHVVAEVDPKQESHYRDLCPSIQVLETALETACSR